MHNEDLIPKFKNVFVLCTGRSGSQTFIRACKHFCNFTAGHESLSREMGAARLDYPKFHIEADNRLSWLLGRLDQRFGDDAFYVHLKRESTKVALSYDQRWGHRFSLIDGYNRSIMMQREYHTDAALDMVDTINANIDLFLASKTHVMEIDIDAPEQEFRRFVGLIGAIGDIDAALEEFSVHHNKGGGSSSVPEDQRLKHPAELAKDYKALCAENEAQTLRHRSLMLEHQALSVEHQAKIRQHKAVTDEHQALRAKCKVLEAELKKKSYDLKVNKKSLKSLKKEFKQFKFWAIVLAMPTLLILSPILVPLLLVNGLRRKLKRKYKLERNLKAEKRNPEQQIKTEQKNLVRKTRKNPVVYDAFYKFQSEGPSAAIDLLIDAEEHTPPGTVALFRAIDEENDDVWLSLMNQWTLARKLPHLSLLPGTGPRFTRLAFPPIDPVDAPELVTIIIPCYNAEASIRQAVQSILNQSWRNIEVIAVNDKSSDDTGEILASMATEDRRVRVLNNVVNVGPYVSKNRALRLAKGVYVTGHDSDDIALPDRIMRQMASIKKNKGAKATIGYMVRLTEAGSFTSPENARSRTHDGIDRLCAISNLCETDMLRQIFGGWDSVRFGADSELIERMELVLGEQFVRSDDITMLCLSSVSGLTNDPETGLNTPTGLSPVRQAYKTAFKTWHQETPYSELRIPYLHEPRIFDAPSRMQVPVADICLVMEDSDMFEGD